MPNHLKGCVGSYFIALLYVWRQCVIALCGSVIAIRYEFAIEARTIPASTR